LNGRAVIAVFRRPRRRGRGPWSGARPMRAAVPVAAVVAVGLGGGCQTPQTRGPGGVKALQINNVRRELEFTARVRDQEQRSKVGAGRTKSEENIFEESVRIELDGSVYHENFLEFTLAGLFGLLQQDFSETFSGVERTSGDDGDILEFDFEGDFLKKKMYPGSVYARRYRSLEARPFLSSLETTTTSFGFHWQYVDPKTPTSLQFNRTIVELDPLDEIERDGRQENSSLRFETAYRFSDTNVLSFRYDRESVDEQPFELQYDSDELTLSDRLNFGEDKRHRLDSELTYFDQRGTFDIRRTRWRENLRLEHTESLRSWFQLEYLDRTQGSLSGVPPIGERSWYVSGTVEHELYQSLLSRLFLFGQQQDFDSDLEIKRYGLQPSLDYRKKNPLGVLWATYLFRLEKEDREGTGRRLEAIDERHTFADPEAIVLSNTNVVVSSIVMTAEDKTTLYRAGRDFRVRLAGDKVEIERVPTGNIRDRETVLIDYVYVFGGDFTLETLSHNVTVRQDFRGGLSPYYRLRRQDQEVDPRGASGVQPEDITAHIYGTEFRRGALHMLAEYEDHDSTVSPFTALRLSLDYKHDFDFGGTARLRTRWTDMDRGGRQDRRTRFLTVEGRYRQTIAKQLTVEAAVLYRTEEDSQSGDDEGVDVDLSLEWLIRDTEVRVTYEYGEFEDDFAENENSALFVQVRRRF